MRIMRVKMLRYNSKLVTGLTKYTSCGLTTLETRYYMHFVLICTLVVLYCFVVCACARAHARARVCVCV